MKLIHTLEVPSYGARNVKLAEVIQDGRAVIIHFENDRTLKRFALCFPNVLHYEFLADYYLPVEKLKLQAETVFEDLDDGILDDTLGGKWNGTSNRWPHPVRAFLVRFQDYGFYRIVASDALLVDQ